jgi:type VI secretion system protein ImpH
MAGPNRQTTDALIAALAEKPYEYNFYSAVRLLQCCFKDQPRIGYSSSPAQDPIRFAQSPALDFAPATLEAFKRKDPSRPPVIYSRHFGLFGPNGPLPLSLTEYARDRILHEGDATFTAFCNIFHHRLASFFFRAWADAQKATDFDRREEEHWSHFVGALIGMGMDSLLDCDSVPNRAKLILPGAWCNRTGTPTVSPPSLGTFSASPPKSRVLSADGWTCLVIAKANGGDMPANWESPPVPVRLAPA